MRASEGVAMRVCALVRAAILRLAMKSNVQALALALAGSLLSACEGPEQMPQSGADAGFVEIVKTTHALHGVGIRIVSNEYPSVICIGSHGCSTDPQPLDIPDGTHAVVPHQSYDSTGAPSAAAFLTVNKAAGTATVDSQLSFVAEPNPNVPGEHRLVAQTRAVQYDPQGVVPHLTVYTQAGGTEFSVTPVNLIRGRYYRLFTVYGYSTSGNGSGFFSNQADLEVSENTIALHGDAGLSFDVSGQGGGGAVLEVRPKNPLPVTYTAGFCPVTVDLYGIANLNGGAPVNLLRNRRYRLYSPYTYHPSGHSFFSNAADFEVPAVGSDIGLLDGAPISFTNNGSGAVLYPRTEVVSYESGDAAPEISLYSVGDLRSGGVDRSLTLLRGRRYRLFGPHSYNAQGSGFFSSEPDLEVLTGGGFGLVANQEASTPLIVSGGKLRPNEPVDLTYDSLTSPARVELYGVAPLGAEPVRLLRGRDYRLFAPYSYDPTTGSGFLSSGPDLKVEGNTVTLTGNVPTQLLTSQNPAKVTANLTVMTVTPPLGYMGDFGITDHATSANTQTLRVRLLKGRGYKINPSQVDVTITSDGSDCTPHEIDNPAPHIMTVACELPSLDVTLDPRGYPGAICVGQVGCANQALTTIQNIPTGTHPITAPYSYDLDGNNVPLGSVTVDRILNTISFPASTFQSLDWLGGSRLAAKTTTVHYQAEGVPVPLGVQSLGDFPMYLIKGRTYSLFSMHSYRADGSATFSRARPRRIAIRNHQPHVDPGQFIPPDRRSADHPAKPAARGQIPCRWRPTGRALRVREPEQWQLGQAPERPILSPLRPVFLRHGWQQLLLGWPRPRGYRRPDPQHPLHPTSERVARNRPQRQHRRAPRIYPSTWTTTRSEPRTCAGSLHRQSWYPAPELLRDRSYSLFGPSPRRLGE